MDNLPLLNNLPDPEEKRIAIHITNPAQRLIRSRHPWLFENSITKVSHKGSSGDLAIVFDRNKKFLAVGLYDPLSPIRVRILQIGKPATINREWFLEKIAKAMELRKSLISESTNGFRLIHGENDSLPGLVVDCYGKTMVLKIYTAAWVPHLRNIASALRQVMPHERVVLRMNRISQKQPELLYGLKNGQNLYGSPLNKTVIFKENGILFESDPIHGQKTGFFLDQRDNRSRVEKMSHGKDVLNVFSYTGGFSLYAARGNAKSVTSLDISKPAIAGSVRNFELNSDNDIISNCPHEYISADAFKAMVELRSKGKRYDIVIIDPPSFAKKESEREKALKAYSRLVVLGLNLIRKEGTLVMASCSSRIKSDTFFTMVLDTAKSINRPLIEIKRTLHGLDHPITFPESEYLKCLFAKA